MQLQLIVAIIIAIVAVVFALQNAVPIAVGFLVWRFQSSLALVLLVTLALGILMSLLVSMPSMIRTRKVISNQKKKIQKLEIDLQKEVGSKTEEEIKDKEPELPLE